jgi:capsular exopolysaccharide synthesis family protein
MDPLIIPPPGDRDSWQRQALPESQPGGRLLTEAWIVLRRSRLLIAACGLVAGLAMYVALDRLRPLYQATTSIRVDEQEQQLPALEVLRNAPVNDLSTEVEMLRARSLAAAVVDSLGLQLTVVDPERVPRSALFTRIAIPDSAAAGAYELVSWPNGRFEVRDRGADTTVDYTQAGDELELRGATVRIARGAARYPRIAFDVSTTDGAIAALMGATTVQRRARDAELIDLRVRNEDPELARDAANALAERFIAERRESRHFASRTTAEFVRGQLKRVTAELGQAERALQDYRESAEVVDIHGQASDQVQRTAELQAKRSELVVERSALQRLLAMIEGAARDSGGDSLPGYRDLVAFPTLIRSDAVSTILNSLAQTEDKRAELRSRRRPEDPEVRLLTERVAALEEQLRVMSMTYLEGLNGQIAAFDSTIARARSELGQIPAKEMRALQLQRDVEGREQLYKQLQSRLKEAEVAEAADDGAVRIVDAAILPRAPVSRNRGLLLLLAPLAGMAVGFGISLVRELRDASVRTRGDAEVVLGVPVLGFVPEVGHSHRVTEQARRLLLHGGNGGHAAHARPDGAILPTTAPPKEVGTAMTTNAYVRLHSSMMFARAPERLGVVVLASALPGDGKTTSAVNLALVMARDGLSVALVDLDLRRGCIHRLLNVSRVPGAAEVLAGRATIDDARRSVAVGGTTRLDVIPTGRLPGSPTRLLASPALEDLLERLAARYEYVLVDTPPLNVVADATLIGAKANSVVIVARAGVTPADALLYAAEQARRARMPVIGALLNDVDLERDAAYDGAYHSLAYGRSYLAMDGKA